MILVCPPSKNTSIATNGYFTDTLILQLGVILNTVPAWKKAYKLRVAVFVEYESDVEEERGRVKSLLEKLRIEAEVLVFWLASGNLPTYEIIVNGSSESKEDQEKVDAILEGEEWWDELQKLRGNREGNSAVEDLSQISNYFNSGPVWPESSFQQGPRDERVGRFLGLRKLLRKSKRKHTTSRISKLGVSLGMRTHQLSPSVVRQHASHGSASEDSSSSSDESDYEALVGDGSESAASEADIDDFESETEAEAAVVTPIKRRRSHGDSMRGPPPSKKSTGEKEIKVPEATLKSPVKTKTDMGFGMQPVASAPNLPAQTETSKNSGSIKDLAASRKSGSGSGSTEYTDALKSPAKSTRKSSIADERPTLSRHASLPKFSSKPVPVTRVATEEGTGPSIMFTDTPSPPPHRRQRLPSAYLNTPSTAHPQPSIPESGSPGSTNSRRGSTYSTQALPLSFNDLPCRAQHLILNELMGAQSKETAVAFTTLPSPVEGTCRDEGACGRYLGDLEVLCRELPPVLLVHSNSMTVTMAL